MTVPRTRGFTLVEILVVVIVVSILMGVVVTAFGGAEREQALQGYLERLALRIEMARDKALQSNREWGLYLDEQDIYFAHYDLDNDEWIELAERPFAKETFDHELEFDLEVEDFALPMALEDDGDGPDFGGGLSKRGQRDRDKLPNVVLFSSGETTPFVLTVATVDWESAPWRLESDGFSRTALTRGELR